MIVFARGEPSWQGKPKEPLRDVLQWLVGKKPPPFVKGYDYSNLTDNQHMELQDWVCMNLDRTAIFWSTGIAIIEAAEAIVAEAVSNGNIPAVDSEWREQGLVVKDFKPRRKVKKARKK